MCWYILCKSPLVLKSKLHGPRRNLSVVCFNILMLLVSSYVGSCVAEMDQKFNKFTYSNFFRLGLLLIISTVFALLLCLLASICMWVERFSLSIVEVQTFNYRYMHQCLGPPWDCIPATGFTWSWDICYKHDLLFQQWGVYCWTNLPFCNFVHSSLYEYLEGTST